MKVWGRFLSHDLGKPEVQNEPKVKYGYFGINFLLSWYVRLTETIETLKKRDYNQFVSMGFFIVRRLDRSFQEFEHFFLDLFEFFCLVEIFRYWAERKKNVFESDGFTSIVQKLCFNLFKGKFETSENFIMSKDVVIIS